MARNEGEFGDAPGGRGQIQDTDVPFQAKADPGPGFTAIAFQLSSIGFAISQRFKATLEPFGIEPRQFSLLRAVGFTGGRSQKELADQLRVPASSMVATIDDLEERDLIERRAVSGDRRVRTLHLTDEGRHLLESVLPHAMKIEMDIRKELGETKAATLSKLLSAVGPIFGVVPGAAHSAMTEHDN